MNPVTDRTDPKHPLNLPNDRVVVALSEALTRLQVAKELVHFRDAEGAGPAMFVARWISQAAAPLLCVVPTAEALERLRADLEYLCPTANIVSLRAGETNPYQHTQSDRRVAMSRLNALHSLAAGQPYQALLTTAPSLVTRLLPRAAVLQGTARVAVNDELDAAQFSETLVAGGYQRVPLVEDPGSFAVRGSLIDVWGGDADEPIRVELFGDSVLELKRFDPETQRSLETLRVAVFPPIRDVVLTDDTATRARESLRGLCDRNNYPSTKARQLIEELTSNRSAFGTAAYLPAFYATETLWDYLPKEAAVCFIEPQQVIDELATVAGYESRAEAPQYPPETLFLAQDELHQELTRRRVACFGTSFLQGSGEGIERLVLAPEAAPSLALFDQDDLERAVKQAHASQGQQSVLEPLIERLSLWREHGLSVTAVARTLSQARRLASLLRHRGVPLTAPEVPGDVNDDIAETEGAQETLLGEPWLNIQVGSLSRGVIALTEKQVFITEEEIFGQRAHSGPARKRSKARAMLEDLRSLSAGDHIVHLEHGVGRYVGLENRKGPTGTNLELLVVEYDGGKLYLPVYRLNQIQKWSGGDKPKIDKLGGQTFAKAKSRAQRRAREMADELLRIYAERHQATRPPIGPPDDDFRTFEAAFQFEETPDQAAAISDVLSDLQRPQVMDRLVCGDVGFGKTEVALRAAFRAASAGRQVAILCPTTVLAQQHFLTFSRRLAEHPITVRALSRFQSKTQSTDTLAGLAKGNIDIVVGTHRLLSKDVQFKNLGLLVIDEEQRFGVSHKERMKQLRTSVDVLTLTATPIPRTMQLALGGLRDMSIIATPPTNRRAIRTIAAKFDETLIREAIERELTRGGQVFYVYNRVEGLYERAARLKQLLPDARIAVGHGQLSEAILERTMLDFVDGEYDVLVATSIIESGLDIPRANTMIVDRADLFGLAQLYQLRGRVGRSQDRAYCYLLVPSPTELSDEARSRLDALERYSELGSGYRVATLDMELRGTGDLLGAEQSGTVASVGFDMFCQMLEEATRELRGEEVSFEIDPELTFDVEALLPDTYIEEVGIRLSLYKRLASAPDEEEVRQLAQEMEDRFGPPPSEALRLVEMMQLKVDLRRLKVLVCEGARGTVSLRFRDDTPLDPLKLTKFVAANKACYRLTPEGKLIRKAIEGEGLSTSLALAERIVSDVSRLLE